MLPSGSTRTLSAAACVQRKLSTAVSEYTFKQKGPVNARSGSSGMIATVFGASGFVGRYVAGDLGALVHHRVCASSARAVGTCAPWRVFVGVCAVCHAYQVYVEDATRHVAFAGKAGSIVFVAHRGEEYEVRHLKVAGDLGYARVPMPLIV